LGYKWLKLVVFSLQIFSDLVPDISYNLANLTQAVVRTLSNLLPAESLDVFIPLIREHFPDTSGMGFALETEDR
jgi:hypothetical protein